MKTKIILSLFAFVGLFLTTNVSADTIAQSTDNRRPLGEVRKEIKEERREFINTQVKPVRQEIRNDKKEVRQENLEQRKDFRQEAKGMLASSTPKNRAETASEIKAEREKMQIELKERRDELQKEIEEKKAEMRKKEEERREEMKKKGQEIREELKKKINEGTINRIANTLDKLSEAVIRYQDMNTRIESRVAVIKENSNGDASKVEAALKIAKDKAVTASVAIENARTTLNQSMTASSTDLISFKATLKTTEEAVKDAREATTKAITALKGLGPVAPKATTTPQI